MRNGDLLLLPRSVRPVVICSVNADSITYSFPRTSLTPRAFLFLLWNKAMTWNCQTRKPRKGRQRVFVRLESDSSIEKKTHNSYKEGDLKFLEIHQKNAEMSARKEILLSSQQSNSLSCPIKTGCRWHVDDVSVSAYQVWMGQDLFATTGSSNGNSQHTFTIPQSQPFALEMPTVSLVWYFSNSKHKSLGEENKFKQVVLLSLYKK